MNPKLPLTRPEQAMFDRIRRVAIDRTASIKSRHLTAVLETCVTDAEREQIAIEAKAKATEALARARKEFEKVTVEMVVTA